jgi:hypothetical protein
MTAPAGSLDSLAKRAKRLRMTWLVLLGFNVVMLVITVPPLIRGDKDAYLHQHARLVAGTVSGIFLCVGSLVARPSVKAALIALTWVSIGVSVWLASR